MKLLVSLMLILNSPITFAKPVQEWSCRGVSISEGETFFSFKIINSGWTKKDGYSNQVVVLKNAQIFNGKGVETDTINLQKGEYCPNSATTEYPSMSLRLIQGPQENSPVGAEVELSYGCGDGYGVFDLSGYCEKTL